ncbi:MAG: methylmalonyl-CoA mutase subunit beta [Hyphomonadaceae bacterium]
MTDFTKDFATPDEETWRKLAEKSLKGAPWEKLVGKTADGIALKPLYRETDCATEDDPAGFPGAAPFVRGAEAERDAARPWHIRQRFAHPDPERTNGEILADLAGGVSAIELAIDANGDGGVFVRGAAELEIALKDVLLDLAPVSLDGGRASVRAASLFADYLRERNLTQIETAFGADPIGSLMRFGAAEKVEDAAALAASAARDFPNATALRVDARPVHEAGGSEKQEIGAALASAIAYLRALDAAGVAPEEASRLVEFSLSIGPDVLIEAAKLRALRLCWARVLEASGVSPARRAARIHATTSRRMMTKHDPWTNILRGTAAAFAASIGDAQAITVAPFTEALGLPTAFARRIARNTQLVLMEESRLGHVIDPAGGAWFVEAMTQELAEAGWAFMQKIEVEGGIVETLTRGWLQEEVAAIREARQRNFALRKETITGVTDFPLLCADAPSIEKVDRAAIKRRFGKGAAPPPPAVLSATPLAPVRWAEPFERLRDRAEGKAPPVFFATLGALSEFSARSNFARNLFAAGGVAAFEPEAVYAHLPQLCAEFAAANTPAAVIVGADAAYEQHAAETASALKAAGAKWVILAGRPGAHEESWRAAGVDQFIFVGRDALESLERLHDALGVRA